MKAKIIVEGVERIVDFTFPIHISIPFFESENRVNAFYAKPFRMKPVRANDFVGSINEGGVVNFFDIEINPHGNGTHTECVGHIVKERYTIFESLRSYFYLAQLISIWPYTCSDGDVLIRKEELESTLGRIPKLPRALIIRTMPNDVGKMTKQYSGSNPPYLDVEAMKYIVNLGVEHLLLDLPSVDREEDGGKLLAHKAFWGLKDNPDERPQRPSCSITEMVYLPSEIDDGVYLLHLGIIALQMDASPSMPVLYRIEKKGDFGL